MKAFSLIELMVIVAIIGISTGVAVPVYQNYMLRARMGTARAYVDSFNHQIKDFYTNNGTFPSNTDLNVPSSVPTSVAGYAYAPYVAYITMEPQTATSGQCNYSVNTAYFSNYQGDYYENGNSNYVVFYNYFIDNDGTMEIKCAFYEFSPSTGQVTTNDIYPDCVKTNTPNTSEIMTYIDTACT